MMNKISFTVTALLALSACSQLPGGTQAGSSTPSRVEVDKCGVTAGFSGPPRRVSAIEMKSITDRLGNYAKWTSEGWGFDRYRLIEVALCMCRDYPFTEGEKSDMMNSLGETSGINRKELSKELTHNLLGTIAEYEVNDRATSGKERLKILFPKNAESCFAIFGVKAPSSEISSTPFLAGIEPSVAAGSQNLNDPKASTVADRLRQLDSLLSQRLITQGEYNERRRRILDGL